MKILITGSHLTPALAVIEELKKHKDIELLYVGRKTTREGDPSPSVESQIVPTLGIKYISLTTGRLQRSFTRYTIPSLLKIPFGFIQSIFIILNEKPDVILSFGGYVAVPIIIVAWLLNIPIMIHEQTLVSGLANTISSWFASKIAVSFDKKYEFPRHKVLITGNPLRKELLDSTTKVSDREVAEIIRLSKKDKKPLLLVTGGNQGSHIINQSVGEILEKLTDLFCIVQQTGDSKFKDFEALESQKKALKHTSRYVVKKWIDASDMAALFRSVDLVVSRAGANTLLELAYFGIPTLLIPIPYISRNEQNVNARFFAEKGLAHVLEQESLSGATLLKRLDDMSKRLEDLKKNAQGARDLVIPDAAKRLALEVILLGKGDVLR
jgi:UDP-N-acetylglucosamine--N-acetylmuramyl-(pentapeptide) pyrophosphoryl-undecaprenol N-acetylglucosamine transferase